MKKSPLKQTIPDFKGTGNRLKTDTGILHEMKTTQRRSHKNET